MEFVVFLNIAYFVLFLILIFAVAGVMRSAHKCYEELADVNDKIDQVVRELRK